MDVNLTPYQKFIIYKLERRNASLFGMADDLGITKDEVRAEIYDLNHSGYDIKIIEEWCTLKGKIKGD